MCSKSIITWREDPVHFSLLDDDCLAVFGAICPDSSYWHSHSNNTVCIALSGSSAQAQLLGQPVKEVNFDVGQVVTYKVKDGQPLVHRVFDCTTTLSFICLERLFEATDSDELKRRAQLRIPNANFLDVDIPFASAARVVLRAGEEFKLERCSGQLPSHTVISPLDTSLDITGVVSVRNAAGFTTCSEVRHGHTVSAIVLREPDVELEKNVVLVNTFDVDLHLAVVDAWVTSGSPVRVKKSTQSAPVSWRDDPVHFPLVEASGITVYGSVNTTSCDWHSHSDDTIYVVLSDGSATNEILHCPPKPIVLNKGHVFVYNLRDNEPLVHRVYDCHGHLAFVGVEVRAPPLDIDVLRAALLDNVAKELQGGSYFATAASFTLTPEKQIELTRKDGTLPYITVFVPLSDGRETKPLHVLHAKSVRNVTKMSEGFCVTALVVESHFAGSCAQDGYQSCIVMNCSSAVWEGVIVDVWVGEICAS